MITHFDIEIYEYRVHVLYKLSDEEFAIFLQDKFKLKAERTNSSASAWQLVNNSGRRESIIDFKRILKKDLWSLNTIVHECLHVTFDILEYIGIDFDYELNNEFYCYLMGYITEKVYAIIYNKNEDKK